MSLLYTHIGDFSSLSAYQCAFPLLRDSGLHLVHTLLPHASYSPLAFLFLFSTCIRYVSGRRERGPGPGGEASATARLYSGVDCGWHPTRAETRQTTWVSNPTLRLWSPVFNGQVYSLSSRTSRAISLVEKCSPTTVCQLIRSSRTRAWHFKLYLTRLRDYKMRPDESGDRLDLIMTSISIRSST